MKRLLYLLLCTILLVSCSSSDDISSKSKEVTTLLGTTTTPIPYNKWDEHSNTDGTLLLLGNWILITENGKPANRFLVFQFPGYMNNSYEKELFVATDKPSKGEEPHSSSSFRYQYNKEQLRVDYDIIYEYKVSTNLDTLSLFDGSNTLDFKRYDNNGLWYWEGSWNEISNPYYTLYRGHYNPVKGTWRVIPQGSKFDNYYYTFKEELRVSIKKDILDDKESTEYGSPMPYVLNGTGIILECLPCYLTGYNRSKYWITGDTLNIQGVDWDRQLQEIYKLKKIKD